MFLPSSSSARMSVCSIDAWKWECIVYDTQARCWNSADQCSLHSLWCAGNSNYSFFNGRKMAVKTISEVHRHGNDLQICLLHFSSDCAGKMPLRLSIYDKKKKNIQAYRKRKKDNKKKKLENVWEDPKVFALMLLWNENLYDFGTIRTNENGDVAALCRHLKSPLLLFCFIIFLCATTVNDWCWLCKWARGKKHG